MKKIFTLIIMVLAVALAMAQSPEKFTYQSVVRNASNALVANAPVGVRVSILQGGVNGTLVYMETQTAVTNANGLITLQIGGGSVQQGSFADIDWANGSYFLKTETDPAGGINYSVTSTQQLLSVPYALYSKEAGNGFSGDYNDLTNLPQIPQIPANVSAFTNDAGYITMDSIPSIPPVPTNVSAFTNDAGYLTSYIEQQTLPDVTANGNSAGNRQLKDVSNPTENSDAVNLRTLTLLMDSLRNNFQQQLQQLQQQMQQQIDSLQEIVSALDTNDHTDNFVCGTSTLTDYDGNVYSTVQIGDQCWMKENLRTTKYADGTSILAGNTLSSTEQLYYDNTSSTIPLESRGYLYNWFAVMHGDSPSIANPSGVQGICPDGWHVPSIVEWDELVIYVIGKSPYLCNGDNDYIAKALASTTGWSSSTSTCDVGNTQSSNNATGFSAVPAGSYGVLGYSSPGNYAFFWSSSGASDVASSRYLRYNSAYVGFSHSYEVYGYSVRCLRD